MEEKSPTLPRSSTMVERLHRLFQAFSGDDRVLIVISADPDAIASAMALKRLLWRRVTSVTVARTNVIRRTDNLALIHYLKMPIVHIHHVNLHDFSKKVVVDGQPRHFGELESLGFDVIIDHHPASPHRARFADIRPAYGATATMMTEYLRAAKIVPSVRLATALYYAIKTDTDNFVRQGQIEDVRAFRFLFPLKNKSMIHRFENAEISRGALKYFQAALGRLKTKRDTAFVFLGVVDNPDTLVILADFFMKISNIHRAITVGLYENRLVAIFRTLGIRRNAGREAIAAFGEFGSAGGHRSMARAEVPLANLPEKLVEKEGALERFLTRRLLAPPPKKEPASGSGNGKSA